MRFKINITHAALAAAFAVVLLVFPSIMRAQTTSSEKIDRTVLPIKEPTPPTYTELDARNVKPPARFEVKAPEGAPNVVIVLIDDMGFGHSSSFGGPINMPTLEKMAARGPRFQPVPTHALFQP